MSWCEWWWLLKFSCSLRVVDEISKADWMELKGILLRVRFVIFRDGVGCSCLMLHVTLSLESRDRVSVRIGVTNDHNNPDNVPSCRACRLPTVVLNYKASPHLIFFSFFFCFPRL